MTEGDTFNRKVITEKAQEVLAEYSGGITLRQLYYRLVAQGMINDVLHYKRVVSAMTEARWQDVVSMEAFIDRERSMYGETKAEVKDLDNYLKLIFDAMNSVVFLDDAQIISIHAAKRFSQE